MTKKILILASLLALTLVGVAIAASGTPTTGNDNIKGTNANDTINALAGNDKVSGRKGDDVLDGDLGNDRVKGDAGDDEVNGGEGNDKLGGGKGDDELNGGDGNDRLKGGRGSDELNGGDGADRIDAKGGGRKRGGPDQVDCGAGDGDVDHVRADRNDTVTGCGPEDKVKQKGHHGSTEERKAHRRAHPRRAS